MFPFKSRTMMFAALAVTLGVLPAAGAADTTMGAMSMKDPMVGGAAMDPSKTIVANAANSKDHTTLVAAIKAAGLVATLNGPGPFTVFAPTNEAFDTLPKLTVAKLLNPAYKDLATKFLTYHVIAGKLDVKDIAAKIAAGGGFATLKTVEGEALYATMSGGKLVLQDVKDRKSTVTIADVYQSNGIIHVVDTVLIP